MRFFTLGDALVWGLFGLFEKWLNALWFWEEEYMLLWSNGFLQIVGLWNLRRIKGFRVNGYDFRLSFQRFQSQDYKSDSLGNEKLLVVRRKCRRQPGFEVSVVSSRDQTCVSRLVSCRFDQVRYGLSTVTKSGAVRWWAFRVWNMKKVLQEELKGVNHSLHKIKERFRRRSFRI